MQKIVILPSFKRTVKKLTIQERQRLAKSLEIFNTFLVTSQAPAGFRFKKINHDKYEFRVDLRLRVIVKQEEDTFYLVLVGSHDEIRRYLRNFR
jgi:mRNA-degrading endonuclease RelE of RelBE toxin-antitoxin system